MKFYAQKHIRRQVPFGMLGFLFIMLQVFFKKGTESILKAKKFLRAYTDFKSEHAKTQNKLQEYEQATL